MRQAIWVLGSLLLAGCATGPGPRGDRAERMPSGMNRTVVTRDHGGPIHENVEPIKVGDSGRFVEPIPCSYPSTPSVEVQQTYSSAYTETPQNQSDKPLTPEIEIGYQRLRIWHKLTTEFDSPDFSQLRWDHVPTLRGDGIGGAFFLGHPGEAGIAFGLSQFKDEHQANAQAEGDLFVRETIRTEGIFLNAEGRFYPTPWLFGTFGAGLLLYEARSTIQTNAPTFTYFGIEGTRVLAGFDVGGGLETPGTFPVHLFVDGRLFLPLSDEEPILESAMGQTTAGIRIHF